MTILRDMTQRFRFSVPLIGMLFFQTALSAPITTIVDGGYSYNKHLQCTAYLHAPEPSKVKHNHYATLHFFQSGTGIYTTYFDKSWINQNNYYLTIDKPGITPAGSDPDHPNVDREFYDYYTTDTLINCAQNALYWANHYLSHTKKSIILSGHSEGSIVMTNLVHRIFSDKKATQLQLDMKALFLSGVVMDKMSDIITYQFKEMPQAAYLSAYQAYDTHNSDYFYHNFHTNWCWMDNALNRKYPLSERLFDLAKTDAGKALPIEIFQGLFDKKVPATSIINFEKENAEKPQEQQLHLTVRYYAADHKLSDPTLSDMRLLLNKYFLE